MKKLMTLSVTAALMALADSFGGAPDTKNAASALVDVRGRDVSFTCRQTKEGCIVDLKSTKKLWERKGQKSIEHPAWMTHAVVTYKPTGKTYSFDLSTTGTLSVALGGKMPDFPQRFADTNLYAAVDLPQPFDLGVTADREPQQYVSQRCLPKFCIKTVPAEFYTRGWALCALSEDPKKEHKFTVRISRWIDDFQYNYRGRSKYAMTTKLVDVDTAKKTKVGEVTLAGKKVPLWLVEFPLDMGDIQDVIRTDPYGNFLGELGRYLDFEVCGPLRTRVSALNDETMNTDPERVSAVSFYGVRLEKSAAEFAMRWVEPGNIFHNDEKPVTFTDVKVRRPGEYVLSWRIGDPEGKVLKTAERRYSADGTCELDLAMPEVGWYSLDWRLADKAGTTLMTHKAAFALLGKDTRIARAGEGPYGCLGAASSTHCLIRNEKEAAYIGNTLLLKVGYRKCGFLPGNPEGWKELAEKYKLGPGMFCYVDREFGRVVKGKQKEEDLVKELRAREKAFPYCQNCQLFWEDSPRPYGHAPEVFGGKYDPAKGMPNMSNRVDLAFKCSELFHKYYPDMPITIGNSVSSTEIVAELMRAHYPEKWGGYMGLEVVGRDNLPERLWGASIQTADYMRELAEVMGYKSWKPSQGVETNYRRDTFLGQNRQAWFYVRDLLLSQAWRFPLCFVGGFVDSSNHYVETLWGNEGANQRYPYCYPKKAYVGLATATKMLDMVVDPVKSLPTGDDCVYAVAYPRKDGKTVTVFWTSYGKAELEVEPSGQFDLVGFYGNALKPETKDGKIRLVADAAPKYLLAGAAVKSARVLKTDPFDTPVPADYRAAVKCDDLSKFVLADHDVEDIETPFGLGEPTRIRAKKPAIRIVDDAERGKCLELDLGEPDLKLQKTIREVMTVFLKEPLKLEGDPESVGFVAKGNSGWGRLYFILEGADGKRTVSTSYREWSPSDWDCTGKLSFGFTGWRFSSYPVGEHSSVVDYSINTVYDLWTTGTVKYPAKLVGFAFSAESRPLFLTEHRQKKQSILLSEIGFFDRKP